MNKIQLANKVRDIARDMIANKGKIEISNPSSLQYADILSRFPKLLDTLINLMSDEFSSFVNNIDWVAPRPTTFKIKLNNGNYFYLIWGDKEFNARISGTNYNLMSVGEKQRAIKAIQELLMIGPIDPNKGAIDLGQNINQPAQPNQTPTEA
jgi:hypothetical protein